MATNCTRMVDVDRLFLADNVRTPECQAIPDMVASLKRHNYRNERPLVVSEKSGNGESTYLVLVGNRRTLGLFWLKENEPETFVHVLPNGKVPCVVHKGLTAEEEIDLRIDHSSDLDRVPLDEWSIFTAIKQMCMAGFDTQERIAVKLGLYKTAGKSKGQPRREYVQVRVNLARMPQSVQDEFRKLTLDKDLTPIRWAHVPRLYKAYNEEYTEYPDATGPKFLQLWKELTTPPEPTEKSDADRKEPKELSPAEAIRRSQSASSKGLKQAFLAVTRQSEQDLSAIDAHLVRAEAALETLDNIRQYLGDKDYAELVDAAKKQHDTDQKQTEVVETTIV